MGDFPNIQAAVDHVQDGDIIELGDGLFQGEGNRDIDYLGKGIVIRSQSGNPQTCIVDCGGVFHRGFLLNDVGQNAVLEGLTIENGVHEYGGAVLCYGNSSPLISNCIFRNNYAEDGGAIYNGDGAFPRIMHCTFAENRANGMGGGLCI